MTPPSLTIHLFGSLRVTIHGEPLPRVRTRSVEWLLALLTLRHGRAVNRAWLAGTLWPESSGSRALQNLRNDLVRLRQALGSESGRLQAPAPESLRLDVGGAAVDVLQFDAAIQAGDEAALRRAVEVYTGPLLEECLEEWAFAERAARAEQFLVALEALAERAKERGDHGEAIRYLRRAQALDPLRDSLPRRLMTHLVAAGDPAAAIQTYRDFRLRLQEELAVAPDEATTRLFHEIRASARRTGRRGDGATGGQNEPPRAQTALAFSRVAPSIAPSPRRPVSPSPLPRPLTSLIGRDQELAQIREALQQGPLVTLVGGGGVGKTRLALEVALRAGVEFPDGAAWVELGPLADGGLVLPSVAASLGIRDGGSAHDADALMRRLIASMVDGAPLLVLDNCEHVLDAAAAVVQMLLQRCPELRILTTSRQRLGLPGEVAWRVPSLSVPGVQEELSETPEHPNTRTPEHLLQYTAVRLFVERAAAVRPAFRLASGAEAVVVGQICRRLDGIPLAIELAAARTRVLTPLQIAERLDDRFKLLTGGARGALPRHQTLRALIDWSYDSLPAEEAALLRRLSVFAGGWTLEAAEAIGGEDGDTDRVLDLLDSLVDHSLVLVDEMADGLRYRLLETVREYAGEKLAGSGERTVVLNQHRDWYLQFAAQAEAASRGLAQMAWLTRLEAEIDNLRAALAWCREAADADPDSDAAATGLRLATASYWLWMRRGYVGEGQQWLESALARGNRCPPKLRASALTQMAQLASAAHQQSGPLLALARQEQEQAVTLARAEGEERETAHAVLLLAEAAASMNDGDAAWSHATEARQRLEALGDRSGLVRAVNVMARVAGMRDDQEALRPLLEEVEGLCRETGDYDILIHVLGARGHLARDAGDFARARPFYQESLLLRRDIGHRIALAQSLEDLAVLAGCEQQAEQAIRLLGAGEAFCETLGARPPVATVAEYERTVAEGRAALGEPAFAAAWAEGRAMSLEQAIVEALRAAPAG